MKKKLLLFGYIAFAVAICVCLYLTLLDTPFKKAIGVVAVSSALSFGAVILAIDKNSSVAAIDWEDFPKDTVFKIINSAGSTDAGTEYSTSPAQFGEVYYWYNIVVGGKDQAQLHNCIKTKTPIDFSKHPVFEKGPDGSFCISNKPFS